MGNFPPFCRVEKKLTEKEIEEVIVIVFLIVVMTSMMKVIFAELICNNKKIDVKRILGGLRESL